MKAVPRQMNLQAGLRELIQVLGYVLFILGAIDIAIGSYLLASGRYIGFTPPAASE